MRRRHLLASGAALASLGATRLARPAIAQGASAKLLKFVPQADLANPDPIWTTATVATNHGYMVWDTLYGINDALIGQPQMVAEQEVSADELTWTFKLREGLKFTDGAPVRGIDCVASIQRWAAKNPFGQQLAAQTDEMKPLDDSQFEIRLKKRFRQMTYALGAQGCFIMPERMAKTPATEQIKEFVGSGPFIFKQDEWQAGTKAVYVKNPGYVPRQEKPEYSRAARWRTSNGWNGTRSLTPPRRPQHCRPARWIGWSSRCSTCCRCCASRLGAMWCAMIHLARWRSSRSITCIRRSIIRSCCARCCRRSTSRNMSPPGLASRQDLGTFPVGFFTAHSPMANEAGIEAFTSKRDLAAAKKLVAESGYNGEKIVMMAPSDHLRWWRHHRYRANCSPTWSERRIPGDGLGHPGRAAREDGPAVARRLERFHTTWGGLATSNPGSSFPLRGNGKKGWFGWPTDAKLEELRDQWFDAPDIAAQKKICEQIQLEAFQSIPFMPVGQWYYPWAVRKDLADFVKCAQVLFWGVRRT